MCGIVGYVGGGHLAEGFACLDVLIEGLEKLEYRGYDSAGVAVFGKDGNIRTVKAKGKLADGLIPLLKSEKADSDFALARAGIGHTRWATHGEPSDINSHPLGSGRVSVVHNGIIENYREIKAFLTGEGYKFESETDTETVVKLIDYYYSHSMRKDPVDAIIRTMNELEGAYALGIIFKDYPGKVYATRKESPLIVGKGAEDKEFFIASDVAAVITHTKEYYLLEHNEIAVLSDDGDTRSLMFVDYHGKPVTKQLQTVTWDSEAAQKGGYEHFMLKEIYEQPAAMRNTISPRVKNGMPDFDECGITDEKLRKYSGIFIVGCGSAMHAGVVGKYVIEKTARVSVTVDIASEFRYRDPLITENDLVIVISQSGETADTLAALKLANETGADTLAIVNVNGSSIARAAKMVAYTCAGPEISVCSTKAYMVQCIFMYLLAFAIARARGVISPEKCAELTAELTAVPNAVEKCLESVEQYQQVAARLTHADSLLYIGRGLDYALSMEGSLKLKEISYIHSESYAAGELKHGTISLITEGMPVVAIATQTRLAPKTLSNIREVKSRGATVITVCGEGISADESDYRITLPKVRDTLMPLVAVVPLQLIAYYTAVLRGNDVDKPRNLAKSVTVE